MRTVEMPHAGLSAPQVILGMMRIADKDDDAIRTLVAAARDAGVDYFDHADIYSPGLTLHECERRFAQAMQLTPAQRDQITLQTKVGIVKDGPFYDFSYEHITASVEESLRALATDYIDVLLLHRPDPLVEPEEVARAFDELSAAGKVRSFGVSNHTPAQMELLRRSLNQPLSVNQMQFSLPHAAIVTEGLAANTLGASPHVSPDGAGVIEYCRMHGISLQAWSPYQSPTGVFVGSPDYPELNDALDRLAQKYEVTPTGIATAWITRHPADIQVVLGTTQAVRVHEAVAGAAVGLQRDEWFELLRAAGHAVP
ncbi:aldo/keto reductase [Nesterenkonia flava]|uniref:Aldo/keto reductase n=1 Tax=Nesterenkonia flava TaxID=469799 RepID=A0ABU1FS64_9MICC|nr:aldo/keto reductase [Nesterenkonia flava]MDR5711495.1 aldo/keto reductase [Nesterenkonia flava]